MNLYHLRHVDWLDSQLLYHALPRVGKEGLLILAPSSPYVCIGYNQNLAQEVDLAFCRENNIPVFRREVGGGAVFLDGDQLFYQLVLHKDNPLTFGSKVDVYERLLAPVVETYHELGVDVHFRPVNDIITAEGRKIAGTGVAEIADHLILVGNIIADFDYKTMSRVLKVPDEKFRDKVFKVLTENLTTIRKELGYMPGWDAMADPLIKKYEKLLGPFNVSGIPEDVRLEADKLKPHYLDSAWIDQRRRKLSHRDVKIATDVNLVQRVVKAPGGLMKADYELREGVIRDLTLSGDYFCYPADADSQIMALLDGKAIEDVDVLMEDFYRSNQIETPGIEPLDWVKVIRGV